MIEKVYFIYFYVNKLEIAFETGLNLNLRPTWHRSTVFNCKRNDCGFDLHSKE